MIDCGECFVVVVVVVSLLCCDLYQETILGLKCYLYILKKYRYLVLHCNLRIMLI
jgi:hypothetical protein